MAFRFSRSGNENVTSVFGKISRGQSLGKIWFGAAVLACVVLTAVTIIYPLILDELPPVLRRVAIQLDLRRENSVAAWTSGMLLFVAALHCADGWTLNRGTNPRIAYSWFVLAMLFGVLSFDEVGSIRERVVNALPGQGLSILPFAAALLAMLFYSLAGMRKDAPHRGKARWILAAFLLFGIVAIQKDIDYGSDWSVIGEAFRSGTEEGADLFAMLILLCVAMKNTRGLFGQANEPRLPLFDAAISLRPLIIVTGLIVAPMLAWWTAGLSDLFRGRPADWLVAVLFMFAASVAARGWVLQESGKHMVAAILLVIASASVALAPFITVSVVDIDIGRRALVLGATVLPAIVLLHTAGARAENASLGIAAVVVVWVTYAAVPVSPALGFLLVQYLALATYSLVSASPRSS